MRTKKVVQFVINAAKQNFGSTELRVFQMVRILENHLGENMRFVIEHLPRKRPQQELWALKQRRGTICVFSDISLKELQGLTLQILRFRGVKTCIDYVDTDLRQMLRFKADVHIGASHTALRRMRDITESEKGASQKVNRKLFLVHHNTDQRLAGIRALGRDKIYPVYLGDIRNTICSDKIADRVKFIKLTRAEELTGGIPELSQYNLHYCIRRTVEKTPGDIIAKPFTKGFIAAQMGAPVLINETVDDAIDLLGADYPFLIPENSEVAILSGLEKVEDCFGGPEWKIAMERMDEMKSVFSHESIASQYNSIFNYLSV